MGDGGGEEERGEGQAANCAPLLFSALIIWSATLSEDNFPHIVCSRWGLKNIFSDKYSILHVSLFILDKFL